NVPKPIEKEIAASRITGIQPLHLVQLSKFFMSKLFLGLDSSTQSLSAVVIDYDTRKVVYNDSLNFDEALPHYKTRNGVLPNRDPLIKHSPPLMWAEALDLVFARMKKKGVALKKILAI